MKTISRFLNDDRGAELAEYAVGVAILVAIAIVVYNVLGVAVNNKMTEVASEIEGESETSQTHLSGCGRWKDSMSANSYIVG